MQGALVMAEMHRSPTPTNDVRIVPRPRQLWPVWANALVTGLGRALPSVVHSGHLGGTGPHRLHVEKLIDARPAIIRPLMADKL